MKLYILPPFVIQSFIWIPCRILFVFFTRIKISGVENIKNLDSGVIFASNHSSELDPILVPSSLPFLSKFTPMFYISKEKSFYKNTGWRQVFYGGVFFKALGAYPAVSGNKNYETSLKNHVGIIEDNESICIFPEGKRSFDGVIREARGGVAYLSHRTKSPIVPVRIRNSHMSFWDFITRKNKIQIVFGRPIYPDRLFKKVPVINEGRNDFMEAAQVVMDFVRKL